MDWENAAKRWAQMLYNRPIRNGVDYFINNFKGDISSITGKNAGGFLKQKEKSEIEENEKRF